MTRTAILLVITGSLLLAGAESKPNFSGTWELDMAASDLGEGPKPRSITEIIKHKEPDLEIDRTIAREDEDVRNVVKLKTDGSEVRSDIGGRAIVSKSTWEGTTLRTVGQGEGMPPIQEIRKIDDKGRMISEMDYNVNGHTGTVRLVFTKK